RRTEKRELRGEELRLLYVATTRARDHLILVGTANSEAADVFWPVAMDLRIGTSEVLSARSHLGWLLRWMPSVTSSENWKDDRTGENDLLRWKIYDENDVVFTNPDAGDSPTANSTAEPRPGADEIESLKSRLNWSYSFQEATERAAKTSVSVLRRQADEEAEQMFQVPSSKFQVERARGTRGLSAAEVGTAHHTFLEHFNMASGVEESGLQAEAERLKSLGVLTIEQSDALDFEALARFWNSEVGRLIRRHATSVKRELEFTARFGTGELDQLIRPEEEIEAAKLAGSDFVVVQGVADLVVILDEEIWLLDFKTDQISGDGVHEKVGRYSVQLRLYALALSRIHRRPVKKCWLHFLSVGRTEAVDVS
ncbi:MAG: DUF2800 domain-containing protein, partial [Verrucomicrobia bacterium]|nr:DUF2800 domain-containing protein [Verrucomicrobiota bacterium]